MSHSIQLRRNNMAFLARSKVVEVLVVVVGVVDSS